MRGPLWNILLFYAPEVRLQYQPAQAGRERDHTEAAVSLSSQ